MFAFPLKRFTITSTLTLCSCFTLGYGDITSLSSDEAAKVQQGYAQMAQEPGQVMFTPPEGWQMADPKALPRSVKIMVVGKGEREFPPSINLGSEKFNGTLKQYLKTVKAINESQGTEWRDLGSITTEAGDANFSQVDAKTQWGEVRSMHVILINNGTVYIMTAAALKEEFPRYYKDFFSAMRSLRINKDLYEMVGDTSRRTNLTKAIDSLKQDFQAQYKKQASSSNSSKQIVFQDASFQRLQWEPFKTMLAKDFSDMSPDWQKRVLERIQSDLTN